MKFKHQYLLSVIGTKPYPSLTLWLRLVSLHRARVGSLQQRPEIVKLSLATCRKKLPNSCYERINSELSLTQLAPQSQKSECILLPSGLSPRNEVGQQEAGNSPEHSNQGSPTSHRLPQWQSWDSAPTGFQNKKSLSSPQKQSYKELCNSHFP